MTDRSTKEKGRIAEQIAFTFLLHLGYDILQTNWVAKKAEIDIIAKEGKTLVFIEVKSRTSSSQGDPATMVNSRKQKLLVSAATQYMDSVNYDGNFRFDIITLIGNEENNTSIDHFKDAFWPGLDW